VVAEAWNLNTSGLAGLVDRVRAIYQGGLSINVDVELVRKGLRGAEICSARIAHIH